MERKRRHRVEALIGSWSFFVFWMFLFGIIGILVADWFTVASWWIWLIGGMAFIGAVAETIRFTAMKRGKRKRLESLIGSWSFFLFFVLLFYVIGIEAAGWWTYDAWWVWLILGLLFIWNENSRKPWIILLLYPMILFIGLASIFIKICSMPLFIRHRKICR